MNREIHEITNGFKPEIPLDEIFNAISNNGGRAVDEAGNDWSGILCGADGTANIEVEFEGKNFWLRVSWHKMESGNWETVAYIS